MTIGEDQGEAGEGSAKLPTGNIQVGVLQHERQGHVDPEHLAAVQIEVDHQRDVGGRVALLLADFVSRRAVTAEEALEREVPPQLLFSQCRGRAETRSGVS